jgi:AcrR family transcriptional regulator
MRGQVEPRETGIAWQEGEDISRTVTRPAAKPVAGRPRNREVGERILAAARALLAEGGYDALTFEAIGARTGIGRPTIYRRWPSKAHLVAAIAYGPEEEIEETGGDLAGQIRALVRQVSRSYRRPEIASAIAGLNSAFQNDASLRGELHAPAETDARRQVRDIVARLKERGEMDPGADADLLFDMVVGAVTFRVMFSSLEAPQRFEEALAERLHRAFSPR